MKKIVLLLCLAALCGCATASRMDQLDLGMTKKEVIKIMGHPASTASEGSGTEFLRYELSSTGFDAEHNITQEYYVKLENGAVVGYGRMGDFGTTKNPTYDYNVNANVHDNR